MKKKILTILLALSMVFTMSVPVGTAFAGDESLDVADEYVFQAPTEDQLDEIIEGFGANGKDIKSSIVGTLFKEILKAAGIASVKWGTDRLLNCIFGSEDSSIDYLTDVVEVMAGKQDEIIDKINENAKLIEITEYQDIIRDFTKTVNDTSWYVKQCAGTLEYIDNEYSGYYVDGVLPEEYQEKIRKDRLTALTSGIGITNYESSWETIDERVGELYTMVTTSYTVPVGNDLAAKRDFYQVYREEKRLTTDWEHLAYDDMEEYNNYMTANYLSAAMIEAASLYARLELCEENGLNPVSIKSRIEELQDEIETVKGLYEKNRVSRDSTYRHYWVPDHEVYLMNAIVRQYVPQENVGEAKSDFTNTKGFANRTLNMDFWKGMYGAYVVNSGHKSYSYKKMATTADIKNMLDGSDHQKSLSKILAEGGFTGLTENSVLLFSKDDPDNKLSVDNDSSATHDYYYVYAKGIDAGSKKYSSAKKIPTYEYIEDYNYFSWYTVYDKRSKTDEYFTLVTKCDHQWSTHWKGLTELGECTKCGATFVDTEPPMLGSSKDADRVESMKITVKNCVYNGKKQTPEITVKTKDGKVLDEGSEYLVTGSRKAVGKGTVTIEGFGEYKGVVKKSFKVIPKGSYITKLKKGKGSLTVRWKQQNAKMTKYHITGYQVRYSRSSKMTNAKKKTIKGYKNTSKKLKSLKKHSKYYVQVRTYKKSDGKTYYSKWSKKKYITTR